MVIGSDRGLILAVGWHGAVGLVYYDQRIVGRYAERYVGRERTIWLRRAVAPSTPPRRVATSPSSWSQRRVGSSR